MILIIKILVRKAIITEFMIKILKYREFLYVLLINR